MGFFEGAWVRGKRVDCTKAATLLPEVTLRFSAPEKPLLSLVHVFLIEAVLIFRYFNSSLASDRKTRGALSLPLAEALRETPKPEKPHP